MRPILHSPYVLFKKSLKSSTVPVWYARFWDENAGSHTCTRSTGVLAEGKKERRQEADARAREILASLVFETETGKKLESFNDIGKVCVVKWKPWTSCARELI